MSIPNCYSGVDNLFDSEGIHPDLALCGHTHRRVEYEHMTQEGKVIHCVNSGNDYYFKTGEVVFDEIEV
jgi:predicted phosphodiesterase